MKKPSQRKEDEDNLIKMMRKSVDNDQKQLKIFRELTTDEILYSLYRCFSKVYGKENRTPESSFYIKESDNLDKIELQMIFEEEFDVGVADIVVEEFSRQLEKYKFTFQEVTSLLQRLPS